MTYLKHFSFFLALAFFSLVPQMTNGATISLSPEHISVHEGETFSIIMFVNASDARAYTVKIETSFTPNTLSFSSWDFEDSWMVLRQSGYDRFDNAQGILVRTGGYAGGFNKTALFGEATFLATEVGVGSITVSPNSFIYNESSENTYSGANKVTVEILPAIVTVPETAIQEQVPSPPFLPSSPPIMDKPNTPEQAVLIPQEQTTASKQRPGISKEHIASLEQQPTLFDVSAEISPQTYFSLIPYLLLILVISIIVGVLLFLLFERLRRQRILERKSKSPHDSKFKK